MLIKFILLVVAVFWMLAVIAGIAFGMGQIFIGLLIVVVCIVSVVLVVRVYHSVEQ
jgi:membrane protein required for beta-lactamase induction